MSNQPTKDDIQYIVNQIALLRNEALFFDESDSEQDRIYNESASFYDLTDKLQWLIDYLADYFGVQKA